MHGTAWWHAAEQHNLAEAIAELREMVGGRNEILAEAAGVTAGAWYAAPAAHLGTELLVAGMLITAGGMTASRWTMASWSVGRGSATSGDCDLARESFDGLRLSACS